MLQIAVKWRQAFPKKIMNILSVTLSANEPIAGWGDNLYGPIGSTISILLGFTRFQWCDPDITANLVPVDFTVNALITSAWDVSNQYRYNQISSKNKYI